VGRRVSGLEQINKSAGVYLECGVSFALGEKIASRDGPCFGIFREIEIDGSETWIVRCIDITWYDTLNGTQSRQHIDTQMDLNEAVDIPA
jgi:hypothetical protein